jgi:hypothetical protein
MSIMKNINYLTKLSRIPCAEPDAWIIIKTAFSSAPPALLTLFQPGCNDIVKMKLGLSPWHLRGIKGLIKGAQAPQALGAKQFLYKIGYFTAEKYLYWWMVADVTTEFLTTWQSQVFQEQQCQLPGAGTGQGQLTGFIYTEDNIGSVGWSPTRHTPGIAYGVGQITVLPGYQASIAYHMSWEGAIDPTQQSPVSTFWEPLDGSSVNDYATTNDPIEKNGNTTGGSWYHNDAGGISPGTYRVRVQVGGPNPMRLINGHFSISTFGRHQGNLTFGCHSKPVEWPFPNIL